MNQIEQMLNDTIARVETHAYKARGMAADLRHNGFDGYLMGDLRKQGELLLKAIHEYQAYMNCINIDADAPEATGEATVIRHPRP